MSADMLIATLAVPAGASINFDAGLKALEAVESTDLYNFEDADQLATILDINPESIPAFEGPHNATSLAMHLSAGQKIITDLQRFLVGNDRDEVTTREIGGFTLIMSGGFSYGDAPTDASEAMWNTELLPENVRAALGLIADYSKPLSRANGAPETSTPTDTDVLDALSLGLGTAPEWAGADTLEWIADLVGTVRPHPGDADPFEYLQAFRDEHAGYEPLEDRFLAGYIDEDTALADKARDEAFEDGAEVYLCQCCALKLVNDDDSGCRDFHNHTHPSLRIPAGVHLVIDVDLDLQTNVSFYDIPCNGHAGGEICPGDTFYQAQVSRL